MNFVLKPSLEHIALVQVAATLWKQHDVTALVRNFSNLPSTSEFNFFPYPHYYCERREEWKEVEDKVTGKVLQLTIPTSLKEKLLGYIQPIGIQILRWIEYHFRFSSFDLDLLNDLCWTPYGTIDKKTTAEVLIKNEAIHITARYKLACIYCLKDVIPELWYELPESYKISFYNEENIVDHFEMELLIFWGHYISAKEASKDNTIGILNPISFSDPYMLQCAAETGNMAATIYFLQKLIEKKHSLDEVVFMTAKQVAKKGFENVFHFTQYPREYCSEVFCFLLSQINNEHQVELFKECPIQALHCLLDCPWQNFLAKTANRLFNFLPNRYDILQIIIYKIENGYDNCNYQKVFRDVWQQMPHAQKRCITDNDNFPIILKSLLEIKDKENIKFVFRDITLTERKKFLFSEVGQHFCKDLIFHKEWDLLKFCVPLCTSSKDEMVKFKKEFEEAINRIKHALKENEKQVEEFFQFLDDLVCGYDKRKTLDDGDSYPVKKFGNIEFKE